MNSQDLISSLLREISYKIGLGLPALDKNGVCAMRYDDKFNFIIEAPDGSEHIFFYSPLVLRQEDNGPLFKKLLQHNFLCMETQGATFALDKENGDIVLCRTHPLQGVDAVQLENFINEFLTTADKWFDQLENWLQLGPDTEQQGKSMVSTEQLVSMA